VWREWRARAKDEKIDGDWPHLAGNEA
jgi:hypothetical protein